MSIVAGVDFGTLSVRVSIFDSERGRLGSGAAEYPLLRKKEDPDHATQRHADHMEALALATRRALEASGVGGREVEAIALDTTGSSVIPVDERLNPIGDYYLWCDHRAWREASEITAAAHANKLNAIEWCGGTYSSEWGFAKLLHWLRNNPAQRSRFATALEHCDMVAAVLCGIEDPAAVPRSICAMGHKWMWNEALGGLPPEEFLTAVDPALAGVRNRRAGTTVGELSKGLENYRPGETGLLRLTWDNGDRTVLVNPELSGVTLGWRLTTTAQDELFAAIEGTACHTRVILERMEEYGVPVRRIINGGGIPQKNPVLNQVYANVIGKPILVPEGDVTSLGSAIFAFLAAGAFSTIEEAQDRLCPAFRVIEPVESCEDLYAQYRELYFAFGRSETLPQLRRIAARVRGGIGAGQSAS
jgi:ribulose kinase